MTEKIKYAIIGAGCMGQEHILNIGIIDDAEVVALCDTSEQSIQESLELLNDEVAIFHDYNDLIDANIADAFIIATPNFTHIDVLKDVMKSEVHLLIEKPLCTTVKDCQEFEKLAENYPGVIWTAMEYRYMPPVQRMIKEIHNNTIGDLKMLSIREHRFPFLHLHHLLPRFYRFAMPFSLIAYEKKDAILNFYPNIGFTGSFINITIE